MTDAAMTDAAMKEANSKIKRVVEGLLMAAGKPLSLDVILGVFSDEERPDRAVLREIMETIAKDCNDRGFELMEVASGYRFQVRQELSDWIGRLWEERPPRYTRAMLETLALVAYRQPITRGDIEEIRGVAVSPNIIRTLLDREWIRIVGHKDVPGKPAMFATTKQFLDYFNLKSLQDLPPLADVRDLAKDREEFDLEDDLADRTVLELPEEPSPDSSELTADDALLLLDEEEAVALSKKPLDEILGLTADLPTEEAVTDDPVMNDSGSHEPAMEESVSDEPAMDEPAADEPRDDESGFGERRQAAGDSRDE